MVIHEPIHEIIGDRTRISWAVELESPGAVFAGTGSASEILWIDWPADYFHPTAIQGDPALLICFPIAMRLGERVCVAGRVSSTLIWNVLEAMAIYQSYYPRQAKAVPLEARAGTLDRVETGRVGSFYSGGVDSLFNVAELKRLHEAYGTPEVTDLWLIRGTDISLTDHAMWEKVKELLLSRAHLPETLRADGLQPDPGWSRKVLRSDGRTGADRLLRQVCRDRASCQLASRRSDVVLRQPTGPAFFVPRRPGGEDPNDLRPHAGSADLPTGLLAESERSLQLRPL
jgi:hypothetical protein